MCFFKKEVKIKFNGIFKILVTYSCSYFAYVRATNSGRPFRLNKFDWYHTVIKPKETTLRGKKFTSSAMQ